MDAIMNQMAGGAIVGQAARLAMTLAGGSAVLLMGAWAAASVAACSAGKRNRRREL